MMNEWIIEWVVEDISSVEYISFLLFDITLLALIPFPKLSPPFLPSLLLR